MQPVSMIGIDGACRRTVPRVSRTVPNCIGADARGATGRVLTRTETLEARPAQEIWPRSFSISRRRGHDQPSRQDMFRGTSSSLSWSALRDKSAKDEALRLAWAVKRKTGGA